MNSRTKLIAGLIFIGLIDVIIPIPILAMVLLYVVFEKPTWFRELVDEVYQG